MKNTVKKHGNADAYRVFLRSLAQKGRFLSELSLWNAALGVCFFYISIEFSIEILYNINTSKKKEGAYG